jgi:hypothetical protein
MNPKRIGAVFFLCFAMILSGCSTAYVAVPYTGKLAETYGFPAAISVKMGEPTMVVNSQMNVPGSIKSYADAFAMGNPSFRFTEAEQDAWGKHFVEEVQRIGLLKSSPTPRSSHLKVDIFIERTVMRPTWFCYVKLRMRLQKDDVEKWHEYIIDSSEGDNFWQKSNTNVADAKRKAGVWMDRKLIKDIESFLGAFIGHGTASGPDPTGSGRGLSY